MRSSCCARLDADAHPMIPGTTCAAETQTVYPESVAATETSRTVIVFGSSVIDAPLSETEHTRVVDAVRETIARTFGLDVVSKAETEAIMREARNGRALGREACAAPLSVADAIEDARPDAIAASVKLECRPEEVETAATRALPELAACASATPVTFEVVLDVDARGRVRVVRRDDEAEEGAACRARVLERIRLSPGSGTRRALVSAWVNRRGPSAGAQSSANTPRGVRFGTVSTSDRRMNVYEARRTVERLVAACDTERVTRRTPLAASITVAIDGTGRVTAATVNSENTAVNRCVEAELARLAYTCPSDRRSAQLSFVLCSFPP
jgi:hypothetical protein